MKNTLLFFALCTILSTTIACKKTYTCECAGGIAFQQYDKEIKAKDSKKAKETCEADNQPPNTPDVINCWLK